MNQLKLNLFEAYYNARKNKRNTYNQLRFEINYEQELFKLYDEIKNKSYKVGKSIAFIINKPVKREIFAASFRDRVVHHLIFNYINPILEPQFIKDSYSCRKGKGTLYGIKQANAYLKEVSNNEIEEDIDFDTLFFLLKEVIYNDPVVDCKIKGSISDWDTLPASKSLFKSKPNCGLPIGNLTSQLFSNVYLNDLDHYMQSTLGLKYYGRYVDDFFVLSNHKVVLKNLILHLKKYMNSHFGLQIHPKKIYLQHYDKGMLFLGAYVKSHRVYIGNRTKVKFKNALTKQNNYLHQNDVIRQKTAHRIVSVLNSYLGLLSHYNTYNLRYKLLFSSTPCLLYKMGYFSTSIKKITLYKNLKLKNNQYQLK